MTAGVLDVDNLDGTLVLLAPLDHADATAVTASGDHDERAGVVLDAVRDLVRRDVHHDGVRLVDDGVGVADGAPVVEVDARDTLVSQALSLDLAQLVLLFKEGDRDKKGQQTVERGGRIKHSCASGFRVKTRVEPMAGWDAHLGLGGGDPVHDEAALRVVDEAEVLVGLVDGNDVCWGKWDGVYGQPSGPFFLR